MSTGATDRRVADALRLGARRQQQACYEPGTELVPQLGQPTHRTRRDLAARLDLDCGNAPIRRLQDQVDLDPVGRAVVVSRDGLRRPARLLEHLGDHEGLQQRTEAVRRSRIHRGEPFGGAALQVRRQATVDQVQLGPHGSGRSRTNAIGSSAVSYRHYGHP